MTTLDIEKMVSYMLNFVEKRGWNAYANPKNLSMALSVEASELVEIFQWLTEKESFDIKNNLEKVEDEIADIFFYLLRICTLLDIDLEKAFWNKTKKNEKKYPLTK